MSDQGSNDYQYQLVEYVDETTLDGNIAIEILEKGISPKSSWESYKVKILAKADSIKKAQKKLNHLCRQRSGVDTADSEPEKNTTNVAKIYQRRLLLLKSRQKLRDDNKNDSLRMFLADYIDTSQGILSCDNRLTIHNFKRTFQSDLSNHTQAVQRTVIASKSLENLQGEKIELMEDKLGMKMPMKAPEDFEESEKLLNLEITEHVMDFLEQVTYTSKDCKKDIQGILTVLIKKAIQLEYSSAGRKVQGVGKKAFNATQTCNCIREFLIAKYQISEKSMNMLTITSDWLSGAGYRERRASEKKRTRNSI
ncbi:uncharacterized protein LOC135168132 [Diachasmimorpha longicaudata]|uniref:uncharacterized protein LOC135168132 n=1 Tax=Diachasmimorpha longicaudata TaxID=58733 RepID=UPI0030B912E6